MPAAGDQGRFGDLMQAIRDVTVPKIAKHRAELAGPPHSHVRLLAEAGAHGVSDTGRPLLQPAQVSLVEDHDGGRVLEAVKETTPSTLLGS